MKGAIANMGQAQLYLLDAGTNKWIPATTANIGGGSSGSPPPATAANQAITIAALQSLDMDNATEAQQIQLQNAIASLQSAWLAENATEAKQDDQITELQNVISALGYTGIGASNLNIRLQEIQARLGNNAIVPALPDIRTLLKELKDEISLLLAQSLITNGAVTWNTPVSGTVDDTAAVDILTPDPNRKAIRVCNLASSAERIYINIDSDASVTDALFVLQQDQTLLLEGESISRVSAIASAGTINYTVRVAN